MADDTLKANRRLLLLCSPVVCGESSRSGSTLATEMSLPTPLGVKVPCASLTRKIPGIDHTDHEGTAIAALQYIYRGVPLKKVLKKACRGVLPECQHLEFIGGYVLQVSFRSWSSVCLAGVLTTRRKGDVSTMLCRFHTGRSGPTRRYFWRGR
jgi:hypothetical protein